MDYPWRKSPPHPAPKKGTYMARKRLVPVAARPALWPLLALLLAAAGCWGKSEVALEISDSVTKDTGIRSATCSLGGEVCIAFDVPDDSPVLGFSTPLIELELVT